ncbi:MAG: hypothetical protein KAU90_00690, partial [Sulfurovaceae bacterium]|nr:hypothetical protein [Sulfurovaceae bacterium]
MRKLLKLFLFFSIFSNAQDYQKQWTDIEDLEKKELNTDQFYIDEKEAFGSINSFISHKFKRDNKTLLLYQEILKSYKKDKNTQELYHANLKRLKFIYKHFNPKNKDKYYIKALNSLETQHMNSEVLYYLAEYYFDKLEYKKALNYAKKGIKNSIIREKCQNIINNIKSKYINMNIEKVNLAHKNILTKIIYKNIHNISIKVFQPSTKKTIYDFNISLPLTNDYKKHSTEISLDSYELGEYIIIITSGNNVIYSYITISNLAYFYKNSKILIVNRESGEPIKGAKVLFYKKNKKSLLTAIKSNKNGIVQIPKTLDKFYIEIEYGKDRLKVKNIMQYTKIDNKSKNKLKEKIYLFTDKDIYKPNENIEFKGIIIKQFLDKKPKVIPNKKVKITLSNNNKKIESKIFKSDEFGSIYGSFHIQKYTIGDINLSSKLGNKIITIQKNILDKNITIKKPNRIINMIIDNQIDKNSAKIIKIDTTKVIRGKVVIEKLKPEDRVYRKRYWNRPDKPLYNSKEFKKLFPDYLYNQNRDKTVIKTIPFNTKKSKEILLEGLEQGEYKLTLYTTNKYGTKIEQIKNIIIYDIHQTKPPYKTYIWHKLDKNSYNVGSTATLYIKSSIPHTKVLFTLIQDNKILKEEWIDINSSTQKLIPITKEYRGDVFYILTIMKNSRKYIQSGAIKVPWDNKLKVEYISFRDKIDINDTKEKWKIKVTNKKGEKVDAQMLATMYKSDNSIQHYFDIGNLYPKHHIG